MESLSITTNTEVNQAPEDLDLADASAVDKAGHEAGHRSNEAKPGQASDTESISTETNASVTIQKHRDISSEEFECTAVGCICQKFGRIEDLFVNGTSMASTTNDTSPWVFFFFFQRSDGWIQLNLIPKDYRRRIIALDRIAEAVEQSPLSCVLTSKPKDGTYQQRGSLLYLFFVQLLEDGNDVLLNGA